MVAEVPTTMCAAVYRPGDFNIRIENDFPVLEPQAGQVLLKIAACGVCHSDVFLLTSAITDERTYVLGHEVSGYPVKYAYFFSFVCALRVGKSVDGIEEGQLYVVYIVVPCAKRSPGIPPLDQSVGIGVNGGFADYLLVDAGQLVRVPDGIPPEVAACAGDSLITVFNAVHNLAGLRPGTKKRVLIYGVGGLGHQAVQLAKSYGATVFAVDYRRVARELAVELGAQQAFSLGEITTATSAAEPFTVDVVIDFVANEQSFTLAKAAIKGNANKFNAPPSKIVLYLLQVGLTDVPYLNLEVLMTSYGSIDDLKSALKLLADGTVKPVVHTAPLEAVDQAIKDLRASAVIGRRIIVPSLGKQL
ncbi:GroES-like protein [Trametes punicea]|nr:GroES-like protein [Trametes punicea]